MLKCRFWYSRSGWGLRICISNQLSGDIVLLFSESHFEYHVPSRLHCKIFWVWVWTWQERVTCLINNICISIGKQWQHWSNYWFIDSITYSTNIYWASTYLVSIWLSALVLFCAHQFSHINEKGYSSCFLFQQWLGKFCSSVYYCLTLRDEKVE